MVTLLLNGGGMDSLAVAHTYPEKLHSLHIDFGYQNSKDHLLSAERIANEYCLSHKVISIQGLNEGKSKASYQSSIYTGLALAYATQIKATKILIGHTGVGFTDDFLVGLEIMVKSRRNRTEFIEFAWPLKGCSDKDIYDKIKSSSLFGQTVSCLNRPVCNTCKNCLRVKNVYSYGANDEIHIP